MWFCIFWLYSRIKSSSFSNSKCKHGRSLSSLLYLLTYTHKLNESGVWQRTQNDLQCLLSTLPKLTSCRWHLAIYSYTVHVVAGEVNKCVECVSHRIKCCYLYLLQHVFELNQELLGIFSFVRDTIQGLGDLALQTHKRKYTQLKLN